MNREIQQKLQWVRLYEEAGDARFVCRRKGISRATLRKWWHRFMPMVKKAYRVTAGVRTHHQARKITKGMEALILDLRKSRNLCARRLQSELLRLHNISLRLRQFIRLSKKSTR
jgi:transposase-like protein